MHEDVASHVFRERTLLNDPLAQFAARDQLHNEIQVVVFLNLVRSRLELQRLRAYTFGPAVVGAFLNPKT